MHDHPLCQTLLPTELLRQIVLEFVRTYADGRQLEKPRQSYKPPWRTVEPLTLASKTFRQLAMEAWFEIYYAQSPEDLLNAWPEFSTWTRELHCVEMGTDLQASPEPWDLRIFHRLHKLRIDFDPTRSNSILLMRFDHPRHIAYRIQELEIYDMSWPSPMALRFIGQAFLGLRKLKLCQDLIWCNLCNICCFATFVDHPPETIVYESVVGLPSHYAQFLIPLTRLEDVTLSIAYGLDGKTSISATNDTLWSGECDACMDMMYASPDWRNEWVLKKKDMARPSSLKSVTWRFRYKHKVDVVFNTEDELDPEAITSGDEESDAEQSTVPSSDE